MAMITSILDTDLYKLTMQAAVLKHYPNCHVAYRFTNRGGTLFSSSTFTAIEAAVSHLSTIALTSTERSWLEKRCPFFSPSYLDYLEAFRFHPDEQVSIEFVKKNTDSDGVEWGSLEIEIKGNWAETIPYEVPIMAIISEAYFVTDCTQWDYVGQLALAKEKGKTLFGAGCVVSEFGTRRRRSYLSQDLVMQGLLSANEEYGKGEGRGKLAGTSNIHFAQKYDVAAIGTIAHGMACYFGSSCKLTDSGDLLAEWIMGIAAMHGYVGSNGLAMDLWESAYPSGALSIALTDTFTTAPFFDDFLSNPERARRWKGLRQDSGDPVKFIKLAKEAFLQVGANPKEKVIVFSDGLDIPKCVELQKKCVEAGVGCSFGVGTTFTNDYKIVFNPDKANLTGAGEVPRSGEPSKALNMVRPPPPGSHLPLTHLPSSFL
ncbi:nicotinate phosphoribosyltransferase, partial [Phenoliferia sp. Uapishka_3]